ncbi:MAG: hypothetical protein OXM02_00685 [Bacteroidota bacterium]|nr:hypothetical protein [Bacteroidota bacterium]
MSYSIAGLQSVVGVLRKYVDKDHKVALILDEAQHLATPSSAEAAASIRSVLNRITNGNVGRKVVLLLGGLSHTWDALRNRGLSRLRLNCVRDLEALKAEESRRVVRDWLMEDGCSPDHIEARTDELADAAENWPQHIVCCVAAALDYFHAYGDRPTASAIRSVLKSADEDKYAFYSARTAGLDTDDIAILGMAAGACGLNAIFETGELMCLACGKEMGLHALCSVPSKRRACWRTAPGGRSSDRAVSECRVITFPFRPWSGILSPKLSALRLISRFTPTRSGKRCVESCCAGGGGLRPKCRISCKGISSIRMRRAKRLVTS